MIRIGKTQVTAICLALVLGTSLMAGGCAKKASSSEMTMAEQAAARADAAASRAEDAASRAEKAASDAAMMAEKAERIFEQKMKK